MKRMFMMILVLGGVMGVSLIMVVMGRAKKQTVSTAPNIHTLGDSTGRVSLSISALMSNPVSLEQPPVITYGVSSTSMQRTSPVLPGPIDVSKVMAQNMQVKELLPIFAVVSNALLSVNHMLESKDYTIHTWGPTIWLISTNQTQSTIWTIYPCRTNRMDDSVVVSSIQTAVYQDAALTQKDQSRSFRMEFCTETGALQNFSWGDKHEVLFVSTEGVSDYGRHLSGQFGLSMSWDEEGHLVKSNVYNWATRGRVINRKQPADVNQ